MNDQEIYQKIGELLWSVMPNEAVEIHFIGCIYSDYSAGGTEWLTAKDTIDSFEMGKRPYLIEDQLMDHILNLNSLDIFKEKWTHFRFKLTDQGRFNAEFGYIPREDSWVNLYMKGISDLSEEELDKDYPYIPKELWEERVRVKNS